MTEEKSRGLKDYLMLLIQGGAIGSFLGGIIAAQSARILSLEDILAVSALTAITIGVSKSITKTREVIKESKKKATVLCMVGAGALIAFGTVKHLTSKEGSEAPVEITLKCKGEPERNYTNCRPS